MEAETNRYAPSIAQGDLVHSMFLVVDLPGIASVGEVKGQTGANLRSYVAEDGRGNKLSGFPNVFNLKFETAAYDAIEAAGVKAGDYVAQGGRRYGDSCRYETL